MFEIVQSHPVLVGTLGILALGGVAAPFARAKLLALDAARDRQAADAKGARAIAINATLDAVTALAATLVLSVEGEVRDLKDPSKPQLGTWNPVVDGPRFLHRVVADLWALGGDTLRQLRELKGLDIESTTKLLERIAEAQVQKLRAPQPATKGATPAEVAALVAEILRDPTAAR